MLVPLNKELIFKDKLLFDSVHDTLIAFPKFAIRNVVSFNSVRNGPSGVLVWALEPKFVFTYQIDRVHLDQLLIILPLNVSLIFKTNQF